MAKKLPYKQRLATADPKDVRKIMGQNCSHELENQNGLIGIYLTFSQDFFFRILTQRATFETSDPSDI